MARVALEAVEAHNASPWGGVPSRIDVLFNSESAWRGFRAVADDGLGDETKGMKLCRNPYSIEETPHTTQDRSPHPRETIPKHLSWITALTRVRQAASSAKNVLSKRASDT